MSKHVLVSSLLLLVLVRASKVSDRAERVTKMANRELEHEGGEERPRRELTCFNLVRSLLLYFLDLGMVMVLLPRGTPVNLRNVLLIFGKFYPSGVDADDVLCFLFSMFVKCERGSPRPHQPLDKSHVGASRQPGLQD